MNGEVFPPPIFGKDCIKLMLILPPVKSSEPGDFLSKSFYITNLVSLMVIGSLKLSASLGWVWVACGFGGKSIIVIYIFACSFFLLFQDFFFHCFLPERISFSPPFRVAVLVPNYFCFPLSENVLTSSTFLRYSNPGYRILRRQFFSFSTWKMLCLFLLMRKLPLFSPSR